MSRTTGSLIATLTLAAGLALSIVPAAQAGAVPADAFLAPAGADAALGELGYRHWDRADAVPATLRFDRSCAVGLPDARTEVLLKNRDKHALASIRSTIRVFATSARTEEARHRATGQVRRCIADRPVATAHLNGMRVATATGTARVFGATMGSARHAVKVEYVVVARDGQAVEVSALHVKTQAVLPKSNIRELARRELNRLATAG